MPNIGTAGYPFGRQIRSFTSNLTRTVASNVRLFQIPGGSSIIGAYIIGAVSDAATWATISIGSDGGSGTEFVAAVNVKTNPVTAMPSSFKYGSILDNFNVSGPVDVIARYDEVGTSSNGGPYMIRIDVI